MAPPYRHDVQHLELPDEATGAPHSVSIVPATRACFELHRDVWRPLLLRSGAPDAEWDWLADFDEIEEPSIAWESYALVDANNWPRALMSIQLQVDTVYVDRLAIAPWNRVGPAPRWLLGCGSAMIAHAVRKSMAKGYGGGIALHAFEEANTLRFYRERIRMREFRIDIVDGLPMRYFELAEADAQDFLRSRAT